MKALICGFNSNTFNFCFNQNTSQTSIDFKYIFPQDIYCPVNYNLFKVKYFQQNDEFLFSCINYDNNLNYVIFNLDNGANIYDINTQNLSLPEDDCQIFNGYDFFFSQDYFVISDYICNMTLIPESTFKEYECTLEKCSKCDLESELKELCQICNELEGYFPLKNHLIEEDLLLNKDNYYIDCFNEKTKPSNYFFNDSGKYYEPCFETCKTCNFSGDELNHN